MAKTPEIKPIIFSEFEKGIAASPEEGHALIRNANITDFKGAIKANYKPQISILFINSGAQTVTFSNSGGSLLGTVSTALGISIGNSYTAAAVVFSNSGGALPTGISASTLYWLIQVSTTTFKIATTLANATGGTAIAYTDSGSGTNTVTPETPAAINWIVKNPKNSHRYAMDSNGRIWHNRNGDNSTDAYQFYRLKTKETPPNSTQGNGLAMFYGSDGKDWLIDFHQTVMYGKRVTNGTNDEDTSSWSSAIGGSFTAGSLNIDHFSLLSTNAVLYWTDSQYIGSLQEKAGQNFDPTSSSTYTFSGTALTLPAGEISKCIEQMGNNLYIGTTTSRKLYPWNRIDSGTDTPLQFPEVGIYRIVNMGNLLIVFNGQKGNIYQTNALSIGLLGSLSQYIVNNAGSVVQNPVTWGDAKPWMNSVLFGASVQTSGNSGLFRIFFDGRITQENTPSIGSANVTALLAETDFYFMGHSQNIDSFGDNTVRYSNYEAVFQSQLKQIGTKTYKGKFSKAEVQCANPDVGSHFRLKYRGDKTSSFADFPAGAITQTTDGNTSYQYEAGLIDVENIQVQVEHDGNLEIMSIILWP